MKKASPDKKNPAARQDIKYPLLSALREAILREREARDFYRERSELTKHDAEVHDIYVQLFQEEIEHESQLLAKFKALCKKWGLDWKTEIKEEEDNF